MTDIIQVTDEGILTLSENEIFSAINEKWLEIDPNFNTDPSTPDGYMNAWHAQNYRILNEAIREAWNSKDPAKARDTQLSIIGSLTGASFEDGTPTKIQCTATGTEGTVILSGSVISGGNYDWFIDNDVTIGENGTAQVAATCEIDGVVEPNVGTVTNIKTTIGGWTGITNTSVIQVGTDKQSNALFRVARTRAVARPSSNQTDSTIGELFAIDDVLRVAAYENPTGDSAVSDENPFGLPKNSETYLIQGGDSDEIAKAIYIKKNPGVYLNGAGVVETVTVTSDLHITNTKLIRFGRPTPVAMNTVIELADPNGKLPTIIETLIAESIISYANGSLLEGSTGFDQTGFDIGENVPIRRIDTPINNVIGEYEGVYINSSTINGVSSGIAVIDFDEISSWSSDNITVTVV